MIVLFEGDIRDIGFRLRYDSLLLVFALLLQATMSLRVVARIHCGYTGSSLELRSYCYLRDNLSRYRISPLLRLAFARIAGLGSTYAELERERLDLRRRQDFVFVCAG